MKGLRAAPFMRIHKGLKLDLILMIAGPAVFLVLAALLEKKMAAAGRPQGVEIDSGKGIPYNNAGTFTFEENE